MTLAQLRYAITVANSNSMNEAARNLFISQPSLSSAIRELEEEIGVELFRRTNRGISVTPEGEEFLGLRPPGGRAIRTDRIQIRFQRTYQEEIQRLHAALYLRG
mgnify:CR=1 FL=1